MAVEIPQVVLFGSIHGGWRENVIIPVLDELGVTYYNPFSPTGWTKELGDREAEVMAKCETIIMVINQTSASFGGLAETGWAALGAHVRGQTFILQIDHDYKFPLPEDIQDTAGGEQVMNWMTHWINASRYLVDKHARHFDIPDMHIVDTVDDVAAVLRKKYG